MLPVTDLHRVLSCRLVTGCRIASPGHALLLRTGVRTHGSTCRRLLLWSVLPLASTTTVAAGQKRLEIRSTPACGTCRIELTKAAVLGADERELTFDTRRPLAIAADSRGRIIAGPIETRGFAVFDSTGRLLRRVGREGSGPGEYRRIWNIVVGPGDSVFVGEVTERRLTVYSPSLEVARTRTFPLMHDDIVALPDGRMILATVDDSPLRAGLPLHLMTPEGAHGKSFGVDNPTYDEWSRSHFWRRLAMAAGGGFWTAPLVRYELELWTDRLERAVTLVRSAPWFPPLATPYPSGRQSDEVRPVPEIRDLVQDREGLLWVIIAVADENWRQTRPAAGAPVERGLLSLAQRAPNYDTIVEVIDPRNGQLLASIRRPESFFGVRGAPLLYTVRENQAGAESLEIWRLSLHRSQPPP